MRGQRKSQQEGKLGGIKQANVQNVVGYWALSESVSART